MREIIECPFCFNRVLPKSSDNSCPNCQKTINDNDLAEKIYSSIEINEKDNLPDYCAFCCEPTTDKYSIGNSESSNPGFLSRIPLLGFLSTLNRLDKSISANLPICDNCHDNPYLSNYEINHEYKSIRIVVHSKFKEAVIKMKTSKSSDL